MADGVARAVADADAHRIKRADVARAVGVSVSSPKLTAAVKEAKASGRIRVVRDGVSSARGFDVGAAAA